jgi:hypothetical protein
MYLTQQFQLPGYDISAEILSEDKINVINGGWQRAKNPTYGIWRWCRGTAILH